MSVVSVVLVVVFLLDDNRNNLYNVVCCLRCFGCRVFIRRQLKQLVQQRMLSPLCWLSCYNFRTTTGTTYTTKNVVLVVLVVVYYFRTTTQTTYTTKNVVLVVFVVVLYFLDDNSNNLYNKECCSRCLGCRLYFWGRQLKQPIQQRMLFLLFWLSCYNFRTTTGTTCTTKNVVLVVLVVVL